jgi:hypothetical protein
MVMGCNFGHDKRRVNRRALAQATSAGYRPASLTYRAR